jgi:hypothetical protein
MPKPFTVLASISVGWSLCCIAAWYALKTCSVVAAAIQVPDLVVGHVRDHLRATPDTLPKKCSRV